MRKMMKVVAFAIFFVSVQCDLAVKTRSGDVVGFRSNSIPDGKEFLGYTGIPYAKPPVGDLRFQDPVPSEPWSGTLDGTKPAPKCLQLGLLNSQPIGQEDCLYLNVYTPELKSSTPKAVMVWIHGGGWVSGSGNAADDLYGPEYFMNEDIVLVTLNYRLNVFGFLSTGDGTAAGNYGLLDIVLALEWVRDNIEAFGGDSRQITIFGESAGAGAVHLLMLSPRAKGLFHKAIAQSGSALCPWAVGANEADIAKKVGAFAGCHQESPEELITCLKNAPANLLVESQKSLLVFGLTPLVLTPRVDRERRNPFLPEPAEDMIRSGKFSDVPFITGVTRNEGYFLHALTLLLGEQGYPVLNGAERPKFLASFLQLPSVPSNLVGKVTDDLLAHYLGHKDAITEADYPAVIQMTSDHWFNKCFYNTLQKHSTYGRQPVFAYVYSHHNQVTFSELLSAENNDEYISHAAEVLVQFKCSGLPVLNENDMNISRIMRELWTSFAKTGKPSLNDLSWPRITPWDFQFLDVTVDPKIQKEEDFPFKDMSIWEKVLELKEENERKDRIEL